MTAYHPVLNLPPLSPEQLSGLRASIAAVGIKVPIVVDEHKQIIDGNNRKSIADELGIVCPEITESGLDEDTKRALARSLNLARRQLTNEQKQQIVAEQLKETPHRSNRWIAKNLGVSHPTVANVRAAGGKLYHVSSVVGTDGKKYARKFWESVSESTKDCLKLYRTPSHVTQALLDRETFNGKILEPAAGDGAIVDVLTANGYKVEAADIKMGQDFLQREESVENIIMNPPFAESKAEAFVRKAMMLAKRKIALLVPFYFLEGVKRHELYSHPEWKVKSVYIFSRRPTFAGYSHHAPFITTWVVWERGYEEGAKIGWVE